MFIAWGEKSVQAPSGATSDNSGCRPAWAKNSTRPRFYKHFAPPGLGNDHNFDPTAPNLSKEQREAYVKYENLMQYGYPTDVPLSQAVKEFNDCFPNKEESPLTENEVIAAIIGGDETSGTLSDPEAVQADFEKILYKRLFPKGARFEIARTTEVSLNDEDSSKLRAAFNASKLTIKRWVITLLRGLDRKPIEGEPLAPGQAFVIRKRYYGFE